MTDRYFSHKEFIEALNKFGLRYTNIFTCLYAQDGTNWYSIDVRLGRYGYISVKHTVHASKDICCKTYNFIDKTAALEILLNLANNELS